METKQRATKEEIFQHLASLLGKEAKELSIKAADEIKGENKKAGISRLLDYDASLGGIGIYTINRTNKRQLGVYRSFFYVWLPIQGEFIEDQTRDIVYFSCCYLEELLKKIVRTWPWEQAIPKKLPLGTLVKRIGKRLPASQSRELFWLSQGVYNFAKHHFNMEEDDPQEPEHYFDLDEAISVYLISRKLGLEIEKLIDKTYAELQME